jgi:hypothetical protein
MARKTNTNGSKDKRVTRYSYENVMEPRTPETGHTALLPADEQVVTVPLDNGWSKAIKVGKLPEGDDDRERVRSDQRRKRSLGKDSDG